MCLGSWLSPPGTPNLVRFYPPTTAGQHVASTSLYSPSSPNRLCHLTTLFTALSNLVLLRSAQQLAPLWDDP